MKRRVLLLACLLLTAAATWAQEAPKEISLTAQERETLQRNNDFAFRLFREVRGEKNMMISPLSITYALGMLNNGAQGKTQQEINEVLGFGDAGVDAINELCHKLQSEATKLDKETTVGIANNIYVNEGRGYHLKKAFVEKAAKYYDVTPEARDFHDGKTLGVINQWGSDHTNGMIPEVLGADEFDPDGESYLLNALYFKGAWQQPFLKEYTMRFYFNNDRNQVCDLMLGLGEFLYKETKLYQAVVLPYGMGAYQMTVLLPREGKSVSDVLETLNGKSWNTDGYEPFMVDMLMPKFETETTQYLEEILPKMGIVNAFGGEGFADFCYEGDDETKSHLFQIELMKQVAKIKVDEEGSEAAAVTVIGRKNGATKHTCFEATRPFIYIISERSTGAIFFMGQYMGEEVDNPLRKIELTDEEQKLVESNNDFAFNLFRQARTGDNQVMSPLSVTYALGMLNNGAAGKTQQEINEVLGFKTAAKDGGTDAINQFCRKLLTECPNLDKTTKVDIANNIYVNEGMGYHLKAPFVEKVQQFYDATPESRDFHDGQTMDVINQWASNHTNGMIPKILTDESFNPDAVSYLLNAIYFNGVWVEKFNPDNTQDEAFGAAKEKVPMMHTMAKFGYTENDLYQAVQLPYGNMAYQMTVILPREGKTIADVIEKMDGKSWVQGFSSYQVDLKLPRFETDTDLDLKPIMSALGMPTAFDWNCAEFPDFCNTDTYIGMMRQSAKIKVNEKGTEAAAVTVIGIETTSIPREAKFYANRPFLYLISEQSTGAIFFIGQFTGNNSGARDTDGIRGITNSEFQIPNSTVYDLKGQRLTTPPTKGLFIQNGKLRRN